MLPYKRKLNAMCFIYNTEHVVVKTNNIYKFCGNLATFTQIKARTDGRQTAKTNL